MLGRSVLWALVGLLALGCAHGASRAPAQGVGHWKELRTRHFRIQTDLAAPQALAVALEFERSYAGLRSILYPGSNDLAAESQAVVFADYEDYQLLSSAFGGFFEERRSLAGTMRRIVMPIVEWDASRQLLQHEIVHRFVAHYFPAAPAWLNEGLAEFLSTLAVEDDGVRVGGLPRGYDPAQQAYLSGPRLARLAAPIEKLRAAPGRVLSSDAYAGAWLFVHVLVLGAPEYRQALECYLERLRSLESDEPIAFASCFAPELVRGIEAECRAAARRGRMPTQVVPLSVAVDSSISMRAMSDADAIRLWASLLPKNSEYRPVALEHVARAIALAPAAPEGYVLRATLLLDDGDERAAEAALRRALELAPDDRQALRALGNLLMQGKRSAVEIEPTVKRVAGSAQSSEDFEFLARWELLFGRPTRALDHATRALRMDPGCLGCYVLAARAAFVTDALERAVSLQRMTLNLAADRATQGMAAYLRLYEAALAASRERAKAPPAAPDAVPQSPVPPQPPVAPR